MLVYLCKGQSYMKSSHSLCQNDTKCHPPSTHPPNTLHIKMPNLSEMDVYNFIHKINVEVLMKVFFLSYKCINKVHKLVYY